MSERRGSYSLAEWPDDVVRLVCDRCGRRGQYRKGRLLSEHPADIAMPDLLRVIANCDRYDPLTGGCGAHYDLDEAELASRMRRATRS